VIGHVYGCSLRVSSGLELGFRAVVLLDGRCVLDFTILPGGRRNLPQSHGVGFSFNVPLQLAANSPCGPTHLLRPRTGTLETLKNYSGFLFR